MNTNDTFRSPLKTIENGNQKPIKQS